MNRGMRAAWLISSSTFFLIITIFAYSMVGRGFDPSAVKAYSVIAALLVVFQAFNNVKVRGIRSWIQIDLAFLLMYFFVHFWIWIALSYDMVSIDGWPPEYSKHVNRAVALSLMGMAAFIFGYNLKPGITSEEQVELLGRQHWKTIGNLIFFGGAALTLAYAFYFGAAAFDGNYTGSAVGNLATRTIYMLSGIFVKLGIAIVLVAHSDGKAYIPKCKIALATLGAILLMHLVLGDRSEFVNTLAVALFAYSSYYRRISLPVMVAGLVAGAFLMSAVQISRTASERSLAEIGKAVTSSDASITSGLNNIAASGGVMLAAVTAVPKEHDYFGGDLKILELVGIIPFGRSLFLGDSLDVEYNSSSTFLTWYILGPNATAGAGTTIVADLYVDFGPTGVVIGLILLGYIANMVRRYTSNSGSIMVAVIFCYFAGLVAMLPRFTYLMIIRGLIWPVLLLWPLKKLLVPTPRTQLPVGQAASRAR
ncbi:MAG: O-antigen polymerase [Gammaproteobacteria bacterium]